MVCFFLVLLTATLGYFVWDGFFPRKLTDVEDNIEARAQVAGWSGVEYNFHPVDQSRKYIVVYLDNPTDYIIRGATVSAQIKVKTNTTNTTITVPNTPCVGPHSELRVLARTAAVHQTCIVTLSAEHSKLVPERDFLGMKTVDLDALEFDWGLTSVEGHAQPIKVLKDIADWFNNWFDKLKAQFARANK